MALGLFGMQPLVSAAGSEETKVKLPSRNNGGLFIQCFTCRPPPSFNSLMLRGASRIVN